MIFGPRSSRATASRAAGALAIALALVGGTSTTPPAGATTIVRNIATVSHGPAAPTVRSNEVTLEVVGTQAPAAQFSITVSSSAAQVAPGQDVSFNVRVDDNGTTPAPASDPYFLDGAAVTGAFALTVVPAGSLLRSVEGGSLYHYVGEKAAEFHSVPPPQLSQIDAVGILLSRVTAGSSVAYSYTVRARNGAEVYAGAALLRVPPSVNVGGAVPSWIQASAPAVTRVVGLAPSLAIYSDKATTRPASFLFLGETGYLKLTAQSCNSDGSAVVTRTATLTTADGDTEQLAAVETAPDSNVFSFAPLLTGRGLPRAGSGRIESMHSGTVSVAIQGCFAPVSIDFQLIDPSGIVFDSASNAALDELDVSLLAASGTACTATLASVLTVDESGALVASPNPYRTRDGGRYQFPLVAAGTYCLKVGSSPAYTFPTGKALASLPAGRRVGPGSLGQSFQVGPEPAGLQERPPLLLGLDQVAVDPGEAVVGLLQLGVVLDEILGSLVEVGCNQMRVDTYRATGAGGQHINTTDSAVRITHLPSGVVVQCQNQRSQHQNRAVAMQVLRSRLYEMELEKRRAETKELEANRLDISFGSQIRNYVLAPYRLVKDARTKLERGDVDSVLNGDIDDFIKEYLLSRRAA